MGTRLYFNMKKYLYLTEKEWVLTWTNGGKIPIKLASTYLSDHRAGTLTPDENLIHKSEVDLTKLEPFIRIHRGPGPNSLTMKNGTFNGRPAPDIINASYYIKDGLILSFSNNLNKEIATRLEKKACVEIQSIERLKEIIDDQIGVKGIMGVCDYTQDHQRNHFLKSVSDSWQDEYRLFWPVSEERWIFLPSGLATEVDLTLD